MGILLSCKVWNSRPVQAPNRKKNSFVRALHFRLRRTSYVVYVCIVCACWFSTDFFLFSRLLTIFGFRPKWNPKWSHSQKWKFIALSAIVIPLSVAFENNGDDRRWQRKGKKYIFPNFSMKMKKFQFLEHKFWFFFSSFSLIAQKLMLCVYGCV